MFNIHKPRAGWLLITACLSAHILGVGTANAADLFVSTTNDVVADDGNCSLREAVSAVNDQAASGESEGECPAGDGLNDTIILAEGRHTLDREPAREDFNVGGDLDVTRTVMILGAGPGTKVVGGLGDAAVVGDGDGIFHIDPAAAGGVAATFGNLQILGGDASCEGVDCEPGAGGINAANADELTIEDCVLADNTVSCSGEDCGTSSFPTTKSAGGLLYAGAGELVVLRTAFLNNLSTCEGIDCTAGPAAMTVDGSDVFGSAEFQDVQFSGNEAFCASPGCTALGTANIYGKTTTITGGQISRNLSTCEATNCVAGPVFQTQLRPLTAVGVEVNANRTVCRGDNCRARTTFAESGGNLFLTDALFKANRQECSGFDCSAGRTLSVQVFGFAVDGLEVSDNRSTCQGETCYAGGAMNFVSTAFIGPATMTRLLIKKNQVSCRGEGCTSGNVALAGTGMLGPFSFSEAEFVSNKTRCKGAGCEIGSSLFVDGGGASTMSNTVVRKNRCSCDKRDCGEAALVCGLYQSSVELTMTGVEIVKNRNDGGAGGLTQRSYTSMALIDSVVAKNRTSGQGGGIANPGTITELTRTTIAGNRSAGAGGGIANSGTIEAITDTIFDRNRADDCVNIDAGVGCP